MEIITRELSSLSVEIYMSFLYLDFKSNWWEQIEIIITAEKKIFIRDAVPLFPFGGKNSRIHFHFRRFISFTYNQIEICSIEFVVFASRLHQLWHCLSNWSWIVEQMKRKKYMFYQTNHYYYYKAEVCWRRWSEYRMHFKYLNIGYCLQVRDQAN